jgi:3-methylfumaryl-CoA hydratase
MAVDITLADLGFAESTTSPLTAEQTTVIAAALDAPEVPVAGERLPMLWHWAHFTPRARTSDLGPDGHPPTPTHVREVYPRRMWASGSLDAPGRLVVGEPAERRSRIAKVKQSEGGTGPLMIVTVEHSYHQRGEVPMVEQQTLIYRTQGEPVPMPRGDHLPDAEPGGWVERRSPTTVQLFRFSAITFNSHRIHYDDSYAREVEGYPALVVHGPLTAMSVASSIEQHTGRALRSFQFRAVAPLFVGLTSTIVGSTDGDAVTATVVRNDGATSMEASATLA